MVTEQCSPAHAHGTSKRGDAPTVGFAYAEYMVVKGLWKRIVL